MYCNVTHWSLQSFQSNAWLLLQIGQTKTQLMHGDAAQVVPLSWGERCLSEDGTKKIWQEVRFAAWKDREAYGIQRWSLNHRIIDVKFFFSSVCLLAVFCQATLDHKKKHVTCLNRNEGQSEGRWISTRLNLRTSSDFDMAVRIPGLPLWRLCWKIPRALWLLRGAQLQWIKSRSLDFCLSSLSAWSKLLVNFTSYDICIYFYRYTWFLHSLYRYPRCINISIWHKSDIKRQIETLLSWKGRERERDQRGKGVKDRRQTQKD